MRESDAIGADGLSNTADQASLGRSSGGTRWTGVQTYTTLHIDARPALTSTAPSKRTVPTLSDTAGEIPLLLRVRHQRENEMARSHEYTQGKRAGIKLAITWLHTWANSMNDPNDKAILNTAAFNLGVDNRTDDQREPPLASAHEK